MARKKSAHAELGKLKEELEQAGPKRSKADAPKPDDSGETPNEAERLLGELQTLLTRAGDEAEDMVVSRPLAALASAFLLGILVGRLLGRR